jgi:stage III sporulation protein AB
MDQGRRISIMLRLLGALCIFAACISVGRQQARKLEKRRLFLRGAHQGLLALMREIDYGATPMNQALPAAAEMAGPAAPVFLAAAGFLVHGNGCTAGEAWQNALGATDEIHAEDKRLLALAGEGLGISDAAQQLKSLELLRLRIENAETEAAQAAIRYGKIWRTMGWSSGALLVLLLL